MQNVERCGGGEPMLTVIIARPANVIIDLDDIGRIGFDLLAHGVRPLEVDPARPFVHASLMISALTGKPSGSLTPRRCLPTKAGLPPWALLVPSGGKKNMRGSPPRKRQP